MEYFDICDENGQPTGRTVERSEAHAKGILHRTAHVWILRTVEGRIQILLQKRSREKDSFPGCWDTSSAGHIPAGSEPVESALRELEEELGIHGTPDALEFLSTCRVSFALPFHGKLFRDEEVAFVYIYRRGVALSSLRLQAEEIEDADWFDLSAVLKARREKDPAFCVPTAELKMLARHLGVPCGD